MSSVASLWNAPEAVACAFVLGARNSARIACEAFRGTPAERELANAKVTLEEAAVVVAQPLYPCASLEDVERTMQDSAALPASLPLTERQRELLAGSEPACCAYARTVLASSATRRAEEQRLAAELADAYAEHREDELEDRELVGVRLLAAAQVDLARAIDGSVVAEVIDMGTRFPDAPAQHGLLRFAA